jgi:hypothetical protein
LKRHMPFFNKGCPNNEIKRKQAKLQEIINCSVCRNQVKYVRFEVFAVPSSGMLHHVDLVTTNVSDELSASIIRVTRIGKLGTTLAVTSNQRTLRRNMKSLCI